MVKKLILLWFGGLILLVSAKSPGAAPELQWLRYHTASEARMMGHHTGWKHLELSSQKPKSVAMPEFKTRETLFTQWTTPMVERGYLWIALDRVSQYGPHDRLYIDSNGDGRLEDETAVNALQSGRHESSFGPVKVVFQVDGGPVTYHLNFHFYNHGNRGRLYAYSGCWYEGNIAVGGSKTHCMLIDQNVNGTFNDKSMNAHDSDRIQIGKERDRDTRYVGNFIEIDSKLYQPEIARDGAYIKLTEAVDIEFGSIRIAENVTEFSAGGENGLLTVKLEKGKGQLPVGRYRVDHWFIQRKDEKGGDWKLEGRGYDDRSIFVISQGNEIDLTIGEPIISRLDVEKRGSRYSFNHSLAGQRGERIELTRTGSRPQAPTLRIKNQDGSYDRTFTFEYG